MDLELKGKVALVTGGSKGLGLGIARLLLEEGVKVSICARSQAPLDEAVSGFRKDGFEVLAESVDVSNLSAAQAWVEHSRQHFGGIDILVNNAGRVTQGTLHELSDENLQKSFALNFFSAVALTRLCAEDMGRRGGGAVINISSIYGRETGGPIAYNATKAALNSLTKTLARELAPKNIRVNTVSPGSIIFPGGNWERRFKENPAFERDFISHEFPAGRLGRPEEVAYAVVMLASPKASWLTGVNMPVDGGQGRSIL